MQGYLNLILSLRVTLSCNPPKSTPGLTSNIKCVPGRHLTFGISTVPDITKLMLNPSLGNVSPIGGVIPVRLKLFFVIV